MYMVSHDIVKQCDFFFWRGGFHSAFGDRPTKWLIAKTNQKKKKKRLKHLCFGMHHN
jgi:hypothetical protein